MVDTSLPPPLPRKSSPLKIILTILLVIVALGAVTFSAWQNDLLPFGQTEEAVVFTPSAPAQLTPVDFAKIEQSIPEATRPFVDAQVAAALQAYDAITPKDARYYETGRTAVHLMTIFLAYPDPFGEGWSQTADRYTKAARAQGSHDPFLIGMCDALHYSDRYTPNLEGAQGVISRAENVLRSQYPAFCKFPVALIALKNLCYMQSHIKDMKDDVSPALNQMPDLYSKVAAEFAVICQPSTPRDVLLRLSRDFLDRIEGSAPLVEKAGTDIDRALDHAGASPGDRAFLQGDQLVTLAWSARGSGWANTVTEDGWRIFGQRLAEAGKLLSSAADKYPDNPAIPSLMITVELGQGTGVYRLNYWFDRAVAIDPGYLRAYRAKMNYLQPRWHGSVREVFEFGLACVKTGLWEKQIPLVLLDGLDGLAGTKDGSEKIYQMQAVWDAIDSTCTEFLKRYPDSTCTRTRYLNFAAKCGKWDVARAQIEILGANWDRSILSEKEFAAIKTRASAKS